MQLTQSYKNLFRFYAITLVSEFLVKVTLLMAQSTYGTVTGTVTDPTGAIIQGAKVEVLNLDTKAEQTALTDAAGAFRVVNLDAGIYTITASAEGFGNVVRNDFHLLAREIARVDFQLQIAATGQQVEVTDYATVSSEALTISDSKSGDDINRLALNFRATNNTSPIGVANLAPGVQPDRLGNISVSGGLPHMTSFSIDGIWSQNVRNGGPNKDLFPSVESIAEFKVNSASSNAEFAQVSDLTVTSKSGGNNYHGALFWFHQNAALNAKDTFAQTKTALVANTFGATLGGPLSIPKLYNGTDHTFFFFTYDGTRRPQQFTLNQIVPPTPWRRGDLSSVTTPILDPFTHAPFPNNQIPVNPVSAKALEALFENPQDPTNTSVASPNFTRNVPGDYTVDGYDGRVDHIFNDRHKVFVRYTHRDLNDSGINNNLSYNSKMGPFSIITEARNLAGSYNWFIRDNLVNEFRAGYTIANYVQSFPLAAQGGALNASLGITNLPPVPASGGLPDFIISGFNETNSFGRPRNVQNTTIQFNDNLTWIKGSHAIKTGFQFRKIEYVDQITFTNGDEFGDYSFDGSITGNAFADFLLGLPNQTDFAQNGPDGRPFAYHYSFFVQDDWRIRRNLTLSYGVRYEINPPFDDETKQLGQFQRDFPGGRLVVQGEKGLSLVAPSWKAAVGNTPFVTNTVAGLPETLRFTYYRNVQPRLGFSWDPLGNGKTIVRSSAGFYSVPVLGAVLYSLLGVDTSNYLTFFPTPSNNLQLPNAFGGSAFLPPCPPACPGYRRANQIDLRDPQVIQWNFSIDRDLGWQTLLRLNYTGSHTTRLIYSPDLNQLPANTVGYAALTSTVPLREANLKYPNFAEVLTRDNGPSAKYHAFTVEVSRRFSKNLNFQTYYTLAKNLSNALGSAPSSLIGQGGQGDNGANAQNYFDIRSDYGDVIYTRRHRFLSTFFYDLPFGRGRDFLGNISRGADLFLGGWTMTGIVLLQSGPFLTPTFRGSDPSGTNPGQRSGGSFQRPDSVPGVDPNLSNPTTNQWFNPAAFAFPLDDIGRFGNSGVGVLHGPDTRTFSMTLGKQFSLTERVKLRFEAAFANLFNVVNLDVPATRVFNGKTLDASGQVVGVLDPSFGRITATQRGEQAGPRNIQMSLRIIF